jgi:hypothetical protein
VVFEPQHGAYYQDQTGTPLGVVELNRFARGLRTGEVLEAPAGKTALPERIALFDTFDFYLRNNFLSVPAFYSVRVVNGGLQWLFESYVPSCDSSGGRRGPPAAEEFDFVPDLRAERKAVAFSLRSFFAAACAEKPFAVVRLKVPPRILAQAVQSMLSGNVDYHPLDGDFSWWPVPRSAFPPRPRKPAGSAAAVPGTAPSAR